MDYCTRAIAASSAQPSRLGFEPQCRSFPADRFAETRDPLSGHTTERDRVHVRDPLLPRRESAHLDDRRIDELAPVRRRDPPPLLLIARREDADLRRLDAQLGDPRGSSRDLEAAIRAGDGFRRIVEALLSLDRSG